MGLNPGYLFKFFLFYKKEPTSGLNKKDFDLAHSLHLYPVSRPLTIAFLSRDVTTSPQEKWMGCVPGRRQRRCRAEATPRRTTTPQ